jgi:hypothetical protein
VGAARLGSLTITLSAVGLEADEWIEFWERPVSVYEPTVSLGGGGTTSEAGGAQARFSVSRDFPSGYAGTAAGHDPLPDRRSYRVGAVKGAAVSYGPTATIATPAAGVGQFAYNADRDPWAVNAQVEAEDFDASGDGNAGGTYRGGDIHVGRTLPAGRSSAGPASAKGWSTRSTCPRAARTWWSRASRPRRTAACSASRSTARTSRARSTSRRPETCYRPDSKSTSPRAMPRPRTRA